MADLPTGTVTFLFTDIEGSTRLWEQHPEAMRGGPRPPRRPRRRGHRSSTAASSSRAGARATASSPSSPAPPTPSPPPAPSSRRSLAEPWPTPRRRCGCGWRCTPARPTLRDGRLLRPGRQPLRPAAGGGPRRPGAALAGDRRSWCGTQLPRGREPARPGRAPPQGPAAARARLPAPAPGPARRLPAAALAGRARPTTCPRQLTSFIGREQEMAEVKRLLGDHPPADADRRGRLRQDPPGAPGGGGPAGGVSGRRLAGGAGAAGRSGPGAAGGGRRAGRARGAGPAADRRRWWTTCGPSGCCWCWTTASTCSPPAPQLADALLRACPQLRILATSREALGIAGEQT